MRWIVFTTVLLAAQTTAFAATSFWVSVGSFQDVAVAERVRVQVSDALGETYRLLPSDTPDGVFQRVVSGPFSSREAAQAAQDHAKSGGYSDTWIFVAASDSTLSADSTSSGADGAPEAAPDTGDDLGPIDDPVLVGDAPMPRPAIPPEVPTEIPPGYQLNSLYRDGRIAP